MSRRVISQRVMSQRTVFVLAGVPLLACSDPIVPEPRLSSSARIQVAVDSLNAAIGDFHAEGGRVELLQLLYPDAYPPDSTIPPVVAIILKP